MEFSVFGQCYKWGSTYLDCELVLLNVRKKKLLSKVSLGFLLTDCGILFCKVHITNKELALQLYGTYQKRQNINKEEKTKTKPFPWVFNPSYRAFPDASDDTQVCLSRQNDWISWPEGNLSISQKPHLWTKGPPASHQALQHKHMFSPAAVQRGN